MSRNPNQGAPDPRDFTDASPNPEKDHDLALLGDALQECSVKRVVVRYAGWGDDGSVEEVLYDPEEAAVPRGIDDWLRVVAEAFCPDGYEDNDGGFGSLTVYPFEGLAELEHTDRYVDSVGADVPAATLPARLRRRLSKLAITAVTARFDGYGDSGQIEAMVVQPETAVLGRDLAEDLEDFLLRHLPDGWDDNEGSFGDFTLDVAAGLVEVDACWRVDGESDRETIRWNWRE
jgi:hypothetical protein